MPFFFTQHQIL